MGRSPKNRFKGDRGFQRGLRGEIPIPPGPFGARRTGDNLFLRTIKKTHAQSGHAFKPYTFLKNALCRFRTTAIAQAMYTTGIFQSAGSKFHCGGM